MDKEKAISIHIGLDKLKTLYYKTDGKLKSGTKDAVFMYETIAKERGFNRIPPILDANATYDAIETVITDASKNLADDGICLITYAGHGGKLEDKQLIEPDGWDEIWCLYDKPMIDDTIFKLLTQFDKETQRVVVISDSCNSGTVTSSFSRFFSITSPISESINKDNFIDGILNSRGNSIIEFEPIKFNNDKSSLDNFLNDDSDKFVEGFRSFKKDYYQKMMAENEFKSEIQKQRGEADQFANFIDIREKLKANVLLISACQDWQLAGDGEDHGFFTKALKEVWESETGKQMNYLQLHEALWKKLKVTNQKPNYVKIGTPNPDFEMSYCFTI